MTLRFLYCSVYLVGAVALVSACAGPPAGTSAQKKAVTALPANSVVLMDPSIDDGMLPAIGEHLSNGAVTIYNLDGPGAALPVDIAPAAGTPSNIAKGAARPIVSDADGGLGMGTTVSAAPLAIKPPTNMTRGDKDPRVTVFDVNTPDTPQTMGAGIGTPVPLSAAVPGGSGLGVASPVRAPATDPSLRPPTLPPPLSDRTQPLKSPFTAGGTLAPASGTQANGRDRLKTSGGARDMTTWNPPEVTSGSGRRAVTSENLMSSSDDTTPPPPRPHRGMTY